MNWCTRRELLRLQQLVRAAYASSAENEQWQLRPGRFVDFVRNDFKVSDQSSAKVRVMTIHKAKGLEFDVVVLPMRLTSQGWAGFTPTVVVGRDDPTSPIKVATRYANAQVRKLLPPDIQAIFEEDRQRNVREAMCVLYVAMTRAVHATHVIVSYGAKVDHKSAAGILLATLCPETKREAGILYEHGDSNWFQTSSPATIKKDPYGLSKFYVPVEPTRTAGVISREIRSGRGIPRTSPSLLEGGDKLILKSIFRSDATREAMKRGKLIHGCFEMIKWLDHSVPAKPDLEARLRKIDPTITDFTSIINSFYEMIERDNVRNLLSLDSYQETYLMQFPNSSQIMLEANRLEVENERPFAVRLQSGILQGVIDRLVLVYEGDLLVAADVIDFKTDTILDADMQERLEFYKPQLAGYRAAVSQFTRLPLERISTRLVFVEPGLLVNLDLVENSASPEIVKFLPKPKRKKTIPPTARAPAAANKKPQRNAEDKNQQRLWPDD